jgi:dihydroceramidase
MGDDLSMFLAVGALLHQLLCFEATQAQRLKYTGAILGSLIPVSVYHVWANEIYVHEIVFAIMVFLVTRRTRALIKRKIKSEESKKRLGSMATFGICTSSLLPYLLPDGVLTMVLASFLFGYFLWSIDFHLCKYVTAFKRSIGLPWGFIFELHGWWHIFTGIGAYIGMALVEYLVTVDDGPNLNIGEEFNWPVADDLRDVDAIEKNEGKKGQ